MAALDSAIVMVSILLVLKILAYIWVCVFVYYTVVIFIEDSKFGRYCWQIALIGGLYFSTGLPIMVIFDTITLCAVKPRRSGRGYKARC
jgi:hypothetical protein